MSGWILVRLVLHVWFVGLHYWFHDESFELEKTTLFEDYIHPALSIRITTVHHRHEVVGNPNAT